VNLALLLCFLIFKGCGHEFVHVVSFILQVVVVNLATLLCFLIFEGCGREFVLVIEFSYPRVLWL